MNNRNSRRWWMTGISAVCLAGVTSLWAADPPAAPAVTTTAPAAAAAAARSADQANTDRRNRNNNNNRGRGNNNNNRGYSGGGGVVSPNDPYAVLQTRSIFVKGNQNLVASTQPVRNTFEPRPSFVGGTKPNLLIFNGVTIVDGKPEAFVEDLGSNVVGTVKPGDAVAGGAVVSITFEELTYVAHGQTMHVGLGDDFNGNAAFSAMAVVPTTGPAPSAPGQLVGAGASIPAPVITPSGISQEDILARMKAKRAQEAQQIGGK